jgi:hypothetical protein
MEHNKETNILDAMERSLFIAADNGILSMLSQKIVPQKIVAILIFMIVYPVMQLI